MMGLKITGVFVVTDQRTEQYYSLAKFYYTDVCDFGMFT